MNGLHPVIINMKESDEPGKGWSRRDMGPSCASLSMLQGMTPYTFKNEFNSKEFHLNYYLIHGSLEETASLAVLKVLEP